MDGSTRRQANEEAVRQFFAAWDPAWRWILLLGLREMRRDPVALGRLAGEEANGNASWSADAYAYGPLTRGITAAAINECAQHCEDLFALLRCLREPTHFAREMGSYAAGKVTKFGHKLLDADDATICRLFLVPPTDMVRAGMVGAVDPDDVMRRVDEGERRLGSMVRDTVAFHQRHEAFHVQYKHGLKLPLRPFGEPTQEAIDERRAGVSCSVFSWSNEPLSAMLRRPPAEQGMMFHAGEAQRGHLVELVEQRNLLRLELVHEVDLDELVERSHVVLRLLQTASRNRLLLGEVIDGQQRFALPGAGPWEEMTTTFDRRQPLTLGNFTAPERGARRGASS